MSNSYEPRSRTNRARPSAAALARQSSSHRGPEYDALVEGKLNKIRTDLAALSGAQAPYTHAATGGAHIFMRRATARFASAPDFPDGGVGMRLVRQDPIGAAVEETGELHVDLLFRSIGREGQDVLEMLGRF